MSYKQFTHSSSDTESIINKNIRTSMLVEASVKMTIVQFLVISVVDFSEEPSAGREVPFFSS